MRKLILSAILGATLLGPLSVSAMDPIAECMTKGEHDAVTFFMVDRSDKHDHEHNLKQTISSITEMMKDGERLVVALSTSSMSSTRVVMDLVKPKKSLWQSALKLRADNNKFKGCLTKLEQGLLSKQEEHNRSAILETLSFASKVLKSESSAKKRVVVYSDMIQNSPALSFYKAKSVNPDAAIKTVESKQLVWNFKNAEVYVSGAGTHSTDEKARQIEGFWTKYFEKAGAELKFYGPVLLGG